MNDVDDNEDNNNINDNKYSNNNSDDSVIRIILIPSGLRLAQVWIRIFPTIW